jgi:hypothetical protein
VCNVSYLVGFKPPGCSLRLDDIQFNSVGGEVVVMAKKKKAPQKKYSVYVIELESRVLEHPKFVTANPNHDPTKACFYVGMTSKTPAARFKDHKENYKANKYACCYGLWLRTRLFQHYNPLTYDQAVKKETQLADRLRKKGHAVWQK